jgi:hypothetical protein
MSLPLDVGELSDTILVHLRCLVIARDRRCRFPRLGPQTLRPAWRPMPKSLMARSF